MATTRSFENNGQYLVTDLTAQLNLITPTWQYITDLGIYNQIGVTQSNITLELVEDSIQLIGDVKRGARHTVNSDETRSLKSLPIPHFTYDDAIYAEELAGRRAYGSDQADTEIEVRARKLARMMRNWDMTHEAAKVLAITEGKAYAPNGTVAIDYYAEFGKTRKVVDFALGTPSTDVVAKNEEVIAHIQDNALSLGGVGETLVIASPEFFTKYVGQANVQAAYQMYSSTQEPLRNRLGGNATRFREFVHAGLRLVEYRGSFNGNRLIPAGKAYAFPTGVDDMFEFYVAPASTFDLVNTIGEKAYMWEQRSPRNDFIALESESNFLALVRRPQAIVELISST